MGVTGRNPLPFELKNLRWSMDRAFEEMLLRSPRGSVSLISATKWKPPTEVFETPNEAVGTVHEDILAPGGETKHEKEGKERT